MKRNASDQSASAAGLTLHHSSISSLNMSPTVYLVSGANSGIGESRLASFPAYHCLRELTVPTLQVSRLLRLSLLVLMRSSLRVRAGRMRPMSCWHC
jgi:hypothetical protein